MACQIFCSIAGIGPSILEVVWCCDLFDFDHSNFA